MYQRKVDVNMLNAVKSVLADVSSISPSSEQAEKRNVGIVSWHSLMPGCCQELQFRSVGVLQVIAVIVFNQFFNKYQILH